MQFVKDPTELIFNIERIKQPNQQIDKFDRFLELFKRAIIFTQGQKIVLEVTQRKNLFI